MKTFTQFITEALANVGELKKAIKKNGFTVPASFKQENPKLNKLTYKAKGGFRGEQVIGDIMTKLQDVGWVKYDGVEKITPDGSNVEYKSSLVSPDKNVVFMSNTGYGGTSWDNFYLADFVLTTDLEEELGRAANYQIMKAELSNLGFRYVDPTYNFVDQFTFVNKGAGNVDAVKKLDSWRSVGENTWEKGDLTATYEKEGMWGVLTIKINAKPYTIKF